MKEKNSGVNPQLNSSSNSQVTQPVNDARNVRRNQQIKALHLQFEDLKKKIKDVESKNQKLIQNIHKQYDFKKKPNNNNSQYSIEPAPVVHYDLRNQQSHATIVDNNHSDNSDVDLRPPTVTKKVNIKKNTHPPFHQSVEYRKTQNYAEERDVSQIGSKTNTYYKPPIPHTITPYQFSAGSQFAISPIQPQQQFQISQFNGVSTYQMPIQFQNGYNGGMSMSQTGSSFYGQNNSQLEQMVKRERERIKVLQGQLQQRQNDIVGLKKIQKKYNALATNCNQTVELCLQQFFSEVVEKRLYEMEKYLKKSQNKLRKIQIKLKDHQEHERSQKNISQHRSKRSSSRSKKQPSPNQNYNSITSVPRMPSAKKGRDSIPNDATSKSRQSESKSSQQFQQIAAQYQQIIKIKTKEVETYQVRFRQKEKQLIEMTAKCAKLQMKIADISTSKSKRDQNLLTGSQFGSSNEKQMIILNKRINQLQEVLQKKDKQLSSKESLFEKNGKKIVEYQNKLKKNELQISKLKEEYKRLQRQRIAQPSTSSFISKLQSDLQLKEREFTILKEKSIKLQNQKLQKQCQNITFTNKIKKIESLLAVKEEKISELQKIIQSSVAGEGGDLLEKSMYLQRMDHNDFQNLQEQKQKLQEQLIKQREDIFILTKNNQNLHSQLIVQQQSNQHLKKQIENLLIQNESMRINIKAQSFQKYQTDLTPLKTLLQEGDAISQDEEDQQLAKNQLEQLKVKHEQVQKALKLQNQKTFQENRKVLKFSSQLKYFKEQLGQREEKYQKLRRQYQQMKYQTNSLSQSLQQKQNELQVQRKVNAQKIRQIQAQWLQFQQQVKNNNLDVSQDNDHELRSSRNFSEESFVNYRNTYNNVNAQNQKLMEKLKQLQKIVEVQKEMQDKIVSQYRSNVQKIKAELREKNKQQQRTVEENEGLKRKIRVLQQNEVRLKELAKGDEQQNLLGSSTQKVIELQMELNEVKEINNKLEAMEHQLFKQIGQKQKELQGLFNALNSRDKRIEELQDIIELKQINFSSHISTSQHKSKVRESLQSQSSLRYSMLSNNNRDKTMQLELSEAGQSFFDQNQSMISNVSEVFGRQEFPYQKMQLKRKEQRRLFQKTAAYIKSLKNAIEEKNKRIKLLQRKIESLRNSQLIRKDIYQIQESNLNDLQPDNDEIFKDYYSVQLQSEHSQRHKFKQLEHQARLTIEQNNLLNNQIQSMQQELLKAEEQQNSLMKLKDLYKDQIKNLIKQNQDQIKLFQDQIKKERQKVEQSQSMQKMEAIKQLFMKIIYAFVSLEAEIGKPKKKEQKKKELQDYLKVCCNLMNLQSSIRQQLSASIREMKR